MPWMNCPDCKKDYEVHNPNLFGLLGPYNLNWRDPGAFFESLRDHTEANAALDEALHAVERLNAVAGPIMEARDSGGSTPTAGEQEENDDAVSVVDETAGIYNGDADRWDSKMRLFYGPNRIELVFPRDKRVRSESVIERLQRRQEPKWIQVAGRFLQIRSEPELNLACEIAAIEHNSYLGEDAADEEVDDEAFAAEMAEIEAQVRARLEAPSSEDDENEDDDPNRPATPSEDMVYERQIYI